MYNDDSKPFEYDDGSVGSTLHTFFEPFFEYDKKVLICVTVTHNITDDPSQQFQYQMGIYRSIGHTKYKFKERHKLDKSLLDKSLSISDDGKGSSYGKLSLKLHAYSSLALDLITMINGTYIERLIVTHPIDSMLIIFTKSGLKANIDYWAAKTNEIFIPGHLQPPIISHETVYDLGETSIHIPPNIVGNKHEFSLDIGKSCRVSNGRPFIVKNTSIFTLL